MYVSLVCSYVSVTVCKSSSICRGYNHLVIVTISGYGHFSPIVHQLAFVAVQMSVGTAHVLWLSISEHITLLDG